jgi:hypothetical protein
MRKITSAVVVVVTVLVFALPALAQEATQDTCGWYWDYTFVTAGGWEYWCWNPQKGWWYGEREDGMAHRITLAN